MSWAGSWPSSSSSSTAAQMATTQPLSSSVPRPQTTPSTTAPEKGGWVQRDSSSIGTTSRWAIRTTGCASLAPGQRNSSPWVCTRVSSRRSCSSGKRRSSSASNASNTSVSTPSRRLTVGIRTAACNASTARSRRASLKVTWGPYARASLSDGRSAPRLVWDPRRLGGDAR